MTNSILQLNPEQVQADSNRVRFGLKAHRVARLAASIMEAGGVQVPVDVEQTKEGYRLIAGHYRHAAVLQLNKEGAGLTLPAIVKEAPKSEVDRIKAQLVENMERENLSPMDEAIAIKAMLDAGATRLQVREAFARAGGRKGLTISPVSNAHLNMLLSFLGFSKSIQEKIHDGRVGVQAAYQLTRVSADKRQEILERAEADRISAIERDEKDEARLLNSEKSVTSASEKAETAAKESAAAAEAVLKAEQAEEKAVAVAKETFAAYKTEKDAEKRKAAEKAHKDAEKAHKEAQAALAKAQKDAAKLDEKSKAAAEYAEKKRKELEDKRKAKKAGKGEKVTAAAVASAAAAADSGHVPLTMAQIRQLLAEMKEEKQPESIRSVATFMGRAFAGELTTKQFIKALLPILK